MLAYETAAFLLQTAEIVQAEGYDGEVSPAQYTAIASSPGPAAIPHSLGLRGASVDHTRHCDTKSLKRMSSAATCSGRSRRPMATASVCN